MAAPAVLRLLISMNMIAVDIFFNVSVWTRKLIKIVLQPDTFFIKDGTQHIMAIVCAIVILDSENLSLFTTTVFLNTVENIVLGDQLRRNEEMIKNQICSLLEKISQDN